MNIKLIRHATVLLTIKNKTLLIDPMLSDKGMLEAIPGVPDKNSNPLVNLPVSIESLMACDAVLISHCHRDHFDAAAIAAIPKDKPIFCQPVDVEKIIKCGFYNVFPVNKNIKCGEIDITRTPAKHGHGVTALAMAPVSGFILSAPGEPTTYITGDTIWYSETINILDKFNPDIAICNCGEAAFSNGEPITMGTNDICEMCKCSPDLKIVTVHMESWNHCRLTRKALKKFISENGLDSRVNIPDNGQELTF
jgi:L-ascorbate metabolism protein UlaG (beta-lactamase superfamily)